MESMIPVLVTAYNRPKKLYQLLDALSINPESISTEVTIKIDGPRNPKEVFQIDACHDISEKFDVKFRKLNVVRSTTNNGLAKSIIEGVTDILNNNDSVIVLEDDLIPSKYFLSYMNKCLNAYKKNPSIGSVSGYSPIIIRSFKNKSSIYLNKRCCSWGWGTWADRWSSIDWSDAGLLIENNQARALDLGQDFNRLIRNQKLGTIDSWAVKFCNTLWMEKRLTIYPFVSKIKNNGMDEFATHTKYELFHPIKYNPTKYEEINLPERADYRRIEQLSFNFYYSNVYKGIVKLINSILTLWGRN
jgi:hypothetical protein